MATFVVYGAFFNQLGQKAIDIDSDTLKAMLVGSSYTPNQDTHAFKSDVTNEVTGTNYTAGGVTLGSVTWTYNTSTNTWLLDCADISFGTAPSGAVVTGARRAVIYDGTPGSDATRPLIGYVDFGSDLSGTLTDPITITTASGLLSIGPIP